MTGIATLDDQTPIDYSATPGSDLLSTDTMILSQDPSYQASLETLAPGITARVDQQQQGGESWTDTLQRLLPTLATTYQQAQLLHIQTERAKQGLPPLDVSQYGVGVQLGLSPSTQKLLILGGVALVAVLYFARRR